MPVSNQGRRCRGLAVSEFDQRGKRLRVVFSACEDEASDVSQGRSVLEEPRKVPFDRSQRTQCPGDESLGAGDAHEGGYVRQAVFGFRHGMRLLIGDHLQTVFEAAQIFVGVHHIVGNTPLDAPASLECPEGPAGIRNPEGRVTPSGDQAAGFGRRIRSLGYRLFPP